jgi:putative peptidoglycan lipid II flippase
MIKQQSTSSSIGKATALIGFFSLLAKLLGLVREAIFAHQFGTSSIIGAYFASFRIPDFIYNLLILGTFSVAFIPVFSEYVLKDRRKADELASSIINTTILMVLVLTLLAFIFINPLVHAIAPGFSGNDFELTKILTKIFLLSPIFFTLSSITASILNTYKRFALMAFAPLLYNVSIIFGAVFLYPHFGTAGLGYGVVLGALLQFIIQMPQVFRVGFRYTLRIVFRDSGFIKFWKLYWPRIFSMGTEQVTALIITIFGSYIGTKALAIFYYANNLQTVFLGIFAISFAIAVFPLLSDLFNEKNSAGFKDVLAKTAVQILFFMIPLSILTVVLRAQIVRLVLGIGQATRFSFSDTKIVAQALGLFSISLFAQALIPLFTRAFYAMQNTIIPVVIGFITIASNILITYYCIHQFGIPGMAIAFSVTNFINLILLIAELHYKLGDIRDEYLISSSLKIVIASLLAGSMAYVSLYIFGAIFGTSTYWGVLGQGALSGIAGGLIYLFVGWLLGLSEAANFAQVLKNTLIKFSKPINVIWNLWP